MWILYSLFILFVILDIIITYLGIVAGHVELNPIIKWLHYKFGLLGHVVFSVVVGGLFLLSSPSFCNLLLVLLVLSIVIGNNLYVRFRN